MKIEFSEDENKDILDVILHGSSPGIEGGFFKKLFEAAKAAGHSALMFNFPFIERGEDHSSGPELLEEIATLQKVLVDYKADSYRHIRLIGKSLGGIIAGAYLKKLDKSQLDKYSLVVLGYVTGSIDIKTFPGKIVIIQGSEDRFGNIDTVKKDMADAVSYDVTFYSVDGADHSYREPASKNPIFEDQAVKLVS